jgi:hypothetical protein
MAVRMYSQHIDRDTDTKKNELNNQLTNTYSIKTIRIYVMFICINFLLILIL